MKIVHIAPNAPYNDYWGYQDNLLPKYQRKMGHEVTVIITNTQHQDGKIVEIPCADYVLNDGVRVIRRGKKKILCNYISAHLAHMDVYSYLKELAPDLIFYHGLVSTTICDVVKYKKMENPQCVIVQDNHLDYNIGWGKKDAKYYVNRFLWRNIHKITSRHITKVYGVTPWRKQYAEDFFRVSEAKTDVLIMGADDEMIDFANRKAIRERIRAQYSIAADDFLIVTGGKIDQRKKIDVLMEAIEANSKVKLLVFGEVLPNIKDKFEDILERNANIMYIGWIQATKVYDYFFAADLVFFPGQHSVLWEQACASKVPCVFECWEGMDHVNNGGNSDFVSPVTVDVIKKKIKDLHYTSQYYHMKEVAESGATDVFLYSNIAKKSIECANEQ